MFPDFSKCQDEPDGLVSRIMAGFCRDCLEDAPPGARCARCGSPRLVCHPELDRLAIAHVDCDAFYAAIEKRDDPSLADQPVIVGGGRRGVVATACYIARTYGIKSAMPMFQARKLCPSAIVVPPNMEKYVAVGRQVRRLMLDLTPLVEPLSIDEAFMDLSGTARLHGASPAKALARFAKLVEADLGITVSIGLSANKFLAKIASDLEKPRGFAVLGQEEARGFLAAKPASFIWGVGKAAEARLKRDGFATIADLQRADETELMRRYGSEGLRLARLARGIDLRRVTPERETKTVSAETTFDRDIAAFRPLERCLWTLTERVSARLKANQLAGSTITLKLKTADFRLRTRARSLDHATALADSIFTVGRDLLARETDGTRYRLLGIGVSTLVSAEQADAPDLIEPKAGRISAAEYAVDRLRGRFGRDAVFRGLAFDRDDDQPEEAPPRKPVASR
jgi:DNA polymerase-4